MNHRVLIAYATKYGATAEIAEKVGQVLTEAGFEADVRPVDQVADLAGPFVEAEKIVLDYVRSPGPKTPRGLIAARAEFQAAVAALRRRIGR